MNTDIDFDPSAVIDRLGGTSEVAAIFGIKPPSVSEWRTEGIPKARLMYLKAVYPHAFEGFECAANKAPIQPSPSAQSR